MGPYKYFQFNYAPFNLTLTSSDEELFQQQQQQQQQSQQETTETNVKFGSGHCLSFTSELMKFTIARLLASKYFIKLNAPKEKIKEIVDNVKQQFILTLKNNEWMDSHTKMVSLDKVSFSYLSSYFLFNLVQNSICTDWRNGNQNRLSGLYIRWSNLRSNLHRSY